MVNGTFYTLQQAYDNGFLSYDDLLSIAYYHHKSLNLNNDIKFNADLMGENYQPIEKSPEILSTIQDVSIRQTVLNELNKEYNSGSFELKNISICAYYGTYNDGVAVRILYSEGGDISLDDVIHEDFVANIEFYYPNYTVFFRTVSYTLNNTILFWKENFKE